MRALLYQINSQQLQKTKNHLDFLKLTPAQKHKKAHYHAFPQEIIHAHLKNHAMKIISENLVTLTESAPEAVCFVKLYLLEKDIVDSL
jgi:hypothetical protein